MMDSDDLHQAIHAATAALRDQHPAIGLSNPWAKVARIAVEAAWPYALEAAVNQFRSLLMPRGDANGR